MSARIGVPGKRVTGEDHVIKAIASDVANAFAVAVVLLAWGERIIEDDMLEGRVEWIVRGCAKQQRPSQTDFELPRRTAGENGGLEFAATSWQ